MDLTNDYYRIFDLPEDYQIDGAVLQQRYRDLQRECHPDRYAGKSPHEQRVAVQYAAAINQAYAVLRSPVRRAQYLLGRLGVDTATENTVVSDVVFLTRQIDLRERLHEVKSAADPLAELDVLYAEVAREFAGQQVLFTRQYRDRDPQAATQTAAHMRFFGKLLNQLDDERDAQGV